MNHYLEIFIEVSDKAAARALWKVSDQLAHVFPLLITTSTFCVSSYFN